jgi:CRISPR-associated endonuclease/helicase Cas3
MAFFAHSSPNKGQGPPEGWELLKDHLRKVAKVARELARSARPLDDALGEAAGAAGLLHDLGKYQLAWQQYLKDSAANLSAKSVPHAIYGAAYAAFWMDNLPVALAVAGHHAGLHDCQGLTGLGQKLTRDQNHFSDVLNGILPTVRKDLEELPEGELPDPFPGDDEHSQRRREFWTRILFSVLVDADRLETERFTTGGRPEAQRLDRHGLAEKMLSKLQEAKAGKAAKGKEGKTDPGLLQLRNRIYDECVCAGERERGFFELTVPTGGGKTLSGMAFALAHARKHSLRRVIVVIPYLSIIEQNAREYRTIFGPESVVEHHSAVGEQEMKGAAGEPPHRTAAELATENWDGPVIVTTSVQFLETLLESSPRRCRKLHNVARSVVLFDEAQALPTHILNPLVNVFRELWATFGCSVVFSTATQPAFRHGPGLSEGLKPGELVAIVPKNLTAEAFRWLQRVNYRLELSSPWDWDTLIGRLSESDHKQVLCVLNTRRHARAVWEKLRATVGEKNCVIHLSSAMCAEHRINVLGRAENPAPGTVRARLKEGLPCWLVSTQAIEAGVDVDFPLVFRALAPLDSIVQAAGRCNREGGLKEAGGHSTRGEVVVFQPADEGMPPGLYQAATGKARTYLGEVTSEQLATDPEVFARYFTELYGVADCDAHGIQAKRAGMQYREVAALARVIADSGTPVIVPYTAAKKWIQRIEKSGTFNQAVRRRLQRYTVNIRANDLIQLQALGAVHSLLGPDSPWVLAEAAYDRDLGVVIRGFSPEDFIQ